MKPVEVKEHSQGVLEMLKELRNNALNTGTTSELPAIEQSIEAIELLINSYNSDVQYVTIVGKIIEGAMQEDTNKVASYANLLVNNYKKAGNLRRARIIENAVTGNKGNQVCLDKEGV
jgi:hypothetical protein